MIKFSKLLHLFFKSILLTSRQKSFLLFALLKNRHFGVKVLNNLNNFYCTENWSGKWCISLVFINQKGYAISFRKGLMCVQILTGLEVTKQIGNSKFTITIAIKWMNKKHYVEHHKDSSLESHCFCYIYHGPPKCLRFAKRENFCRRT